MVGRARFFFGKCEPCHDKIKESVHPNNLARLTTSSSDGWYYPHQLYGSTVCHLLCTVADNVCAVEIHRKRRWIRRWPFWTSPFTLLYTHLYSTLANNNNIWMWAFFCHHHHCIQQQLLIIHCEILLVMSKQIKKVTGINYCLWYVSLSYFCPSKIFTGIFF